MTMDPSAYHVVYVDRRARRERIQRRDESRSAPIVNGAKNGSHEHAEVARNVEVILAAFTSVSVCTSAASCISFLSDIERSEPTPTLVLLDIPLEPQPEEEANSHDGRHDSGIASSPEDILYGLPLLNYLSVEIENQRMSEMIIPVAFVTDYDGDVSIERSLDAEAITEPRELQCIDNGARDVLRSPLQRERIKALYLRCYRARRSVQKIRKRSWVGVDEHNQMNDEAKNYAYIKDQMVSELMTDICRPRKTRYTTMGKQLRISTSRAQAIEKAVGTWEFSAHDYTDEELVYGAHVMFEHALQMPEVSEYKITSERLNDFLIACRSSYDSTIPYHNFRHVVDVMQAVFYFLLQCRALPEYAASGASDRARAYTKSLAHLVRPLDALTLLVVAVGHDVGHPGVNNAFLVNLKAPLAQVYNDRSVLESFHCAAFSQVLNKYWPKTMEMRKMMIDMILATDMGLHFDYMNKLEKLLKKYEREGPEQWEPKTVAEQRNLLCALLIKCADISNVARKHECSAKWATILMEEFSRQASMETDLGIPSALVAPPVKGSVVALAKSQVGFIKLFAIPLFTNISKALPEMGFSVRELQANLDMWNHQVESFTAPPEETIPQMTPSSTPSPPKDTSASKKLSSTRAPDEKPSSSRFVPAVLGTVLGESRLSAGFGSPTIMSSNSSKGDGNPRPGGPSPLNDSRRSSVAIQRSQSGDGNSTAVTVVVTHPKPNSPPLTPEDYDLEHFSEKRPSYQHSTEHLRAEIPSGASTPDRPRSSPPDLGDVSDHSCSKGCCGATTVVATGTVQRRSSKFFKKMRIWKQWKKEETNEG